MSTLASIPSVLLRTTLVFGGLLAVSACSDAPPVTGGSSESGEASTSSGPAMPSPSSSSGLDSTATESSGSSGSTGTGSSSGSGSTAASSSDSGSTGTASSSDSDSTGTASSSDSGSTDSGSTDSGSTASGSSSDSDSGSTGGGGSGFCGLACTDVVDCASAGGDPLDWACTSGFCEYVGMIPPCDPTTCPAAAGLTCAEVDGQSVCVIPCTPAGNECVLFDLECTGVTDAGDMICQSAPCLGGAEGDPCIISGAGQFGTCTGGLCTCADDTECTAAGYACDL